VHVPDPFVFGTTRIFWTQVQVFCQLFQYAHTANVPRWAEP
jgi:hypothetical protein